MIVVFGAAVRADGLASAALMRRIMLATELADRYPDATLFLSGAVGRHAPSEASVMTAALARHIASDRLVLDERSRDTLPTVQSAVAFARARSGTCCIACTDRYHQPRARMLFRLFGMASGGARFASRPPTAPFRLRWRMRLREAAALPYDLVAGVAAVRRAERGVR